MTQLIDPEKFTNAVTLLRNFFTERSFIEVHTQNRLSILAACEDPTTVATYNYAGEVWPLPQTGQMWLEYELLKSKGYSGSGKFFCISTSYRQEPKIVEGRHDLIFPMFEFEFPGILNDLKELETELIEWLGYYGSFPIKDYTSWCKFFDTSELTHQHEISMSTAMITNFPNNTSPFWNMKQNGDGTAAKIDVILAGMETIGSAERSCNPEEMRDQFYTISDGMYANLLFGHFGKERVQKELEDFLSLDFIPRVGGGIGITRLIRALDIYETHYSNEGKRRGDNQKEKA